MMGSSPVLHFHLYYHEVKPTGDEPSKRTKHANRNKQRHTFLKLKQRSYLLEQDQWITLVRCSEGGSRRRGEELVIWEAFTEDDSYTRLRTWKVRAII